MTQVTSNNAGKSHKNEAGKLRQPRISSLEERAAGLLGVYLAAAHFVVAAYPETRHCMLHLTESVGAGAVPIYLFARFSSTKALVVLATALAVVIPWLLAR